MKGRTIFVYRLLVEDFNFVNLNWMRKRLVRSSIKRYPSPAIIHSTDLSHINPFRVSMLRIVILGYILILKERIYETVNQYSQQKLGRGKLQSCRPGCAVPILPDSPALIRRVFSSSNSERYSLTHAQSPFFVFSYFRYPFVFK